MTITLAGTLLAGHRISKTAQDGVLAGWRENTECRYEAVMGRVQC